MFIRLALEVSCLVGVDDVVLLALVDSRGELGECLLSCFFIASFSCIESLLAKGLHAAGKRLITCGAGLVLADALES